MKEDKIKKLIQQSKLETSNGFTERLIHKLEAQPKQQKTPIRSYQKMLFPTILIVVFMSYLVYRFSDSIFSLFNTELNLSNKPIFMISSIFFLFLINYMIRLNEAYKKLNTI
ncbi:hypothetical protein MTsPCn5_12750 [Croceitalea sp. MTPC5]|uniref:hypothetical protein n=1 Tax=Croceitalea sp. MTPC5 TaxID=3056565 RepID=UPI002B3FABEB|nr:hypothetical protein MTsPCn5_12750 [Croceitalea sp. MTPC5]